MTTSEFLAEFEKEFAKSFADGDVFDDAMRYACFGGGKRVRPVCVFLGAEATGRKIPVDEVASLARAIELIHSYSLVHDDLPAMDNDDYRRGRLTVHRQFGEATAILVGDALLSKAAALLAADTVKFGNRYAQAAAEMTVAAEQMVRGQVLDLAGMNTAEEFRHMYFLKTGALIRAAMRAGAIVAGADEEQLALVTECAENTGLAFQLADDLLDDGDEKSLLSVLGEKAVRRLLADCTDRAVRCASRLPEGKNLAEFAKVLQNRKN